MAKVIVNGVLCIASVLAASLLLPGYGELGAHAANASEDRPPNVIYILADDLGYGDLGAFGQQHIETPSLDKMAEEGMRLTQHYAGSTVCAPSRASLVTGKQPGVVQIRGNYELGTFLDEEEYGQMPLRPGTETIGTMMQDAGYKTALIGKWGLGGPESYGTPNKQGFDYFFGYLDQKQAHNHYPTHLWLNEERFPLDNTYLDTHQKLPEDANPNDPASYLPYKREDFAQQRLADDALRYITEHKDDPFFLFLSFATPHASLQAPDADIAAYAESGFVETPNLGGGQDYMPVQNPKAVRAAMISHLDRSIGDVLAKLEELQLDENTLVIFSSDNGPSWEGGADLAFFDANGPFRGYKRDLYEGGIRMPTIAWWPEKIHPGSNSDHMSAFWDLMPTLAEVAGVDSPETTDGISFLPTLLGETGQKLHSHLYWEFHNNNGNHAQAIRLDDAAGQWKAVRLYNEGQRENPPVELYNLKVDLAEQHNVAGAHPERVAQILALMKSSRTRADIDSWNFDYWPQSD
ncbi:arylsulfatase [Microbulbifer agarilyticus]|uniref:arylsulfatase n=1 Tax=Microbulbifer agarilyticus TaxID=260552 RepID=UPI001CD43807|nr:arylsulfatase [Microbulbifer agarilyticus]MCA0900810.1 arylsulfatase [Microbulbifer agarilyticus]